MKTVNSVDEFFSWAEQNVNGDSALCKAAKTYNENKDDTVHEGPFLTIVTRTQGKRPEMLEEVLLCVSAQSDTDFEHLIVAHNVTDGQAESVKAIIANLPAWQREKTVFLPVYGGTRGTPLNKGFEAAKGEYIVVLDDDDIVFEDWVESFKELAQKAPGKLLHEYAYRQNWEVVGGEYPNTPRAIDAPESAYCSDFCSFDQYVINRTPQGAIAYPAYVFKKWGVKFDETLNTTEDWDFLMRCSFLTGVVNGQSGTFLYRMWKNTENSAALHNQDEWNANYKKILERFKNTPALSDRETVSKFISDHTSDGTGNNVVLSDKVMCYYDCGNGFNGADSLHVGESDELDYGYMFTFDADAEKVSALRVDPHKRGNIIVTKPIIKVLFADGTEQVFTEFAHNGRMLNGAYVFLKDDPQLTFALGEAKKVNKVYASFDVATPVPDAIIDRFTTPVAVRGFRKLKRICRRILHK